MRFEIVINHPGKYFIETESPNDTLFVLKDGNEFWDEYQPTQFSQDTKREMQSVADMWAHCRTPDGLIKN